MGKHTEQNRSSNRLRTAVGITLASLLVAQGFALPAFADGESEPLFHDWVLPWSEVEARSAQAGELNTGEAIDGQRVFTLYSNSSYELGTIKVSLPEEAIQRLAANDIRVEGVIGWADDFTIITSSEDFQAPLLSSGFSVAPDWFTQLEADGQAVNPFAVEGGLVHSGGSVGNWQAPQDGRLYQPQGRFDATAINASYYEGQSLSPSSPALDGLPQHSGVVVLDDADSAVQEAQLDALRPLDHNAATLTDGSLGFWLTTLSGSQPSAGTWAGSPQTSLTGGVWVSIDRSGFNPLPADFEEYTLLDQTTSDVEVAVDDEYRYITTVSTYEREMADGRTEKVRENLTTTLGTPFGGTLPQEWTGSLVAGSVWLSDEVRDTALVSVEGNWDGDGYFVNVGGNIPTGLTVVGGSGSLSINLSSEAIRLDDWYGTAPQVGEVLSQNDLGGVLVTASESTPSGWRLTLDPVSDDARLDVREGLSGENQSLADVSDGIEYLVSDTSFSYQTWIEGEVTPTDPPTTPTEPPTTPPVTPTDPPTTPPVTPTEPPVTEPPVTEPPTTEPPTETATPEEPTSQPPVQQTPTPENPTQTETNAPAPPFRSDSGLDELTQGRNLAGIAGFLGLIAAGAVLYARKLRAV